MSASAILVGLALAPAVALYAMLAGFDRDRSFYSAVVIVVASYYALFAAIGGDTNVLAHELPAFLLFLAGATIGFRRSAWILVAALAGHGLFDAIHGALISNPATPLWWPSFCLSYDFTAAACLAVRIRRASPAAPSLALRGP